MDLKSAKAIIFETLPDDSAEEYYETRDALKDLEKQYRHFTNTVWKASKQLLKFDEINRLVATEVEESAEKTGSTKSSGSSRSSGSAKTSSTRSSGSTAKSAGTSAAAAADEDTTVKTSVPLSLTVSDLFFNWGDLNWESILMKILAGLSALAGGIVGGMVGGVPGAIIGLTAGLVFGILADNTIFNLDGKLSADEIRDTLLALLPAIGGGILGFVAGGPAGAAIGLVLGASLSLKLLGIDWTNIKDQFSSFFEDLKDSWSSRWESFTAVTRSLWDRLKTWWNNLSLGSFSFRVPHLTVSWQELASDSILAKYLGITAIPHLGVEWYARGGIVDGATLIGAGEQGKEAVIPLERHTEWIRMVAVELKAELEKLAPVSQIRTVPALASGLVPYAAAAPVQSEASSADLSGLADTIARAIAELGNREAPNAEIRVYLDGKQLSDAVTKYQRRSSRANGN